MNRLDCPVNIMAPRLNRADTSDTIERLLLYIHMVELFSYQLYMTIGPYCENAVRCTALDVVLEHL
jgi:hypothetical protein